MQWKGFRCNKPDEPPFVCPCGKALEQFRWLVEVLLKLGHSRFKAQKLHILPSLQPEPWACTAGGTGGRRKAWPIEASLP